MLDLRDVNRVRAAGLIPAPRYLEATLLVRDRSYWQRWALRALLALGAGHLLAGIVFFFAYNWAEMTPSTKLGLIEAGIVGATAAALLIGLDRLPGQAALIGASVLTGALLAVIGQVYHTNADAYELFAAWTLLILPWTIGSRSAAHWLLWLVVAFLALGLYGGQALVPDGDLTGTQLFVLLGLAAVLALATREAAARAGFAWLAGQWTRLLPLLAALAFLFGTAAAYLLDLDDEALGVAVFVAVAAAAAVYGRQARDFAALAVSLGFAGLFLILAGGRVIDEAIGFGHDEAVPVLASIALLVAWSVLVTGVGTRLLQALRPRPEDGLRGRPA